MAVSDEQSIEQLDNRCAKLMQQRAYFKDQATALRLQLEQMRARSARDARTAYHDGFTQGRDACCREHGR